MWALSDLGYGNARVLSIERFLVEFDLFEVPGKYFAAGPAVVADREIKAAGDPGSLCRQTSGGLAGLTRRHSG
jgi:hypothetical protein